MDNNSISKTTNAEDSVSKIAVAKKRILDKVSMYLSPQSVAFKRGMDISRCMVDPVANFTKDPECFNSIFSLLVFELTSLCAFFNVPRGMSEFQITELADIIIDTYGDLTVDDYVLFCKSVKVGFINDSNGKKYEYDTKLYGYMDSTFIQSWLKIYVSAKIATREHIHEVHGKKKVNMLKDWDSSVLSKMQNVIISKAEYMTRDSSNETEEFEFKKHIKDFGMNQLIFIQQMCADNKFSNNYDIVTKYINFLNNNNNE